MILVSLIYYFFILSLCSAESTRTSALPPPEEWQHSVYLTADDGVQTSHYGKGLPFGESISFETDSFKGQFFLRLRNGVSSPYFDGKTCLSQLVIQGQFKID